MRAPTRLQIWALCVLPVVAVGMCPGYKVCQVRQLGSPQPTTKLLKCNGTACQSATFDLPPAHVCLIHSSSAGINGGSTVRIYLGDCFQFIGNAPGYFLQGSSVVPSLSAQSTQNTTFYDISCATICEAIEVVIYKSKSNGQMLVEQNSQVTTSSQISCDQGFYVYPNVIPFDACNRTGLTNSSQTGPTGPSGPGCLTGDATGRGTPPKRLCPSQTQQRALLTVTDDVSMFAVGAPEQLGDGSYHLPIVNLSNGEVFHIQKYLSQAVGESGEVELVTAYTLQIASSGKYLVADVLDDTTLNYAGLNTTGLTLKNASEFPDGYATTADYRFFVRYDLNASIGNLNASVFCPLFHRNHCLLPAVLSGYLRLAFRRRVGFSVEPTFVNPTDRQLWDFVSVPRDPSLVGPWHVGLQVI